MRRRGGKRLYRDQPSPSSIKLVKPKMVGENVVVISNIGSGFDRFNGTLVFTIFVLALATVVFILVLNKRLDDQNARDIVRAERPLLEDAITNLHQSLILEQSILFQKSIAIALEANYSMVKLWILGNIPKIQSIDDLTGLATMINGTIINITIGFINQITVLENTLLDLLSVSSQTMGSVIKSGTCTMQGTTSTIVDYEYKKLTVSGLDYFYYVFNSSLSITIDNTGASIESCSPNIYLGSPQGEISPIFIKQRESFTGDGANEINGVQAGTNKLELKTTSFGGTKSLGISSKKLTHFVSFH